MREGAIGEGPLTGFSVFLSGEAVAVKVTTPLGRGVPDAASRMNHTLATKTSLPPL